MSARLCHVPPASAALKSGLRLQAGFSDLMTVMTGPPLWTGAFPRSFLQNGLYMSSLCRHLALCSKPGTHLAGPVADRNLCVNRVASTTLSVPLHVLWQCRCNHCSSQVNWQSQTERLARIRHVWMLGFMRERYMYLHIHIYVCFRILNHRNRRLRRPAILMRLFGSAPCIPIQLCCPAFTHGISLRPRFETRAWKPVDF